MKRLWGNNRRENDVFWNGVWSGFFGTVIVMIVAVCLRSG